jgi:hypothetical protein
MTVAPDLHCLLPNDEQRAARRDALVLELRDAPMTQTGRSRRRATRAAVALAAIAIIAAIAGFALPGGQGRSLDVVAQARAAVTPRHEILHVRSRLVLGRYASFAQMSEHVIGGGGPIMGRLTGETERWSATSPTRQRTTTFIAPAAGGAPLTMQEAYADGVLRFSVSWQPGIQVDRLPAAARRTYERPASPGLAETGFSTDADPVATIRSLLNAGMLRADGHQNLNGRDVRRLVGKTTTNTTADHSPSTISYVYLIDADTYAPVQITSTQVLAARPHADEPAARHQRRLVTRLIFKTYERIPLNDKTEALLRISAPPHR